MLKLIEEQQRKLNSQNESIHDNYYNDNDNYQSSIEQEYYNSDLFDTEFHNDLFNTEMLTEIGDNQDDLDCNDSRYYIRRGYVFSDEEEEEDETITYARGVINCILDDEEEKEHLHRFKNEDRKIITDKYDYDHKILKKKNYQRFNQKSLEGFLKVLSNEKENDREEDISYDEKYENILLNTNPKPSFMHKYRFYIISIILFTIGYFLFL
ncbi:hypothetical protein BCR36DRAFT_580092 [Piromyces finnis]|uniref:Uncharacterized protein n=1 Tax=Piromyces finnis TaxID=1754191 RepID=A0A1Y1VK71_9FUNG|nr:hypothetical protein BCR36DRAFT_580092 [Piromyces finnis]|eukprot:ORX58482.1 hypothetical protein BCR36DRAFT_580092 [Piromyces finnis]